MKVLGVVEKKGNYQNTDYHNVMIHCSVKDEKAIGVVTEVIKVKFTDVSEVFGQVMSNADWQKLIGKEVKASYDKYGRCSDIRVIEPKN